MNKTKIKALVLASGLVLVCFGLSGCANHTLETVEVEIKETKKFAVGEHVISVPISKKTMAAKENIQYKYYPGYEPVAFSLTAFGKGSSEYSGGAIAYANIEEVECESTITDKDGNYLFIEFANGNKDIEEDKEVEKQIDLIKEFDVGEHIISVPLDIDVRKSNYQYDQYDGYEVVGMGLCAFGHGSDEFAGGAVLYKNVKPVVCTRVASGDYGFTTFGIPKEMIKVKTLKQE